MALVTRQLDNTGSPLYTPSGVLLAGVVVTFTLVDFNDQPTGAFDATTHERVVGLVAATTDANGEFIVDLWPNDRGDRTTKYACTVNYPGADRFISIVPSGVVALAWIDFLLSGATLTPIQVTALDVHIASLNAHGAAAVTSVFGRAGAVAPVTGDYEYGDVVYPTALKIGVPTHVNGLQSLLDHTISAGIIEGCAITDNLDGTVSIAAGNALIRASADPHSSLYNVRVAAQANIPMTADATNYVYLSYNAGSPVFTSGTTIASFNGMDNVLAWVVHRNAGVLMHTLDARNVTVDNPRKMSHMFLDYNRFAHATGGTHITGPSGLAIAMTAGHFYFMLGEYEHTAFDTTVAGTANANVFTLWNRVAGVWTSTEGKKLVDSTLYDNGTNPTVLGNNKYGNVWFYMLNDSPSELHAVMGQAEYANQVDAEAAAPPTVVPTTITGLCALAGVVTFVKSGIVFLSVRSPFAIRFG